MNLDQLYGKLTVKTNAKLVLLVLDGLGDLATKEQGYLTPLEAASTPNLDALTQDAAQGRMTPVAPGITPGSGPGHLALFGYDPLEYEVGRGVIEALGLGLVLKGGDVAARANFCTLDAGGIVTDRRAGRIETPVCEELCSILSKKIKKIDDTEVIIKAGKGHRFVVIFRGKGLEGPLTDADPNREGHPIPTASPVNEKSAKQKKTAKLIESFYKEALPLIAKKKPANGFLMRGIAHQPEIPLFQERYQLRPACLAVYPMYKGLAQLVGMNLLEGPQTISEQFQRYVAEYDACSSYPAACPVGPPHPARQTARCAGHHRRPLHPVRGEGTFLASPAFAAHLRLQRIGQTRSLHGNRSQPWLAWRFRGQISHPLDAGQRPDVRQVRSLTRNSWMAAFRAGAREAALLSPPRLSRSDGHSRFRH